MKFLAVAAATLAVLPSSMACLHTWGYLVKHPLMGTQMDYGAQVVDDKRVVCSNSWGMHKDGEGRFVFNCLSGYSYSVSSDGRNSRFSNNGGQSFSWGNSVKQNKYCCVGACEDKGPKLKCTDMSFDTWMFTYVGKC